MYVPQIYVWGLCLIWYEFSVLCIVWDEVEYAHGLQERKGGEYMNRDVKIRNGIKSPVRFVLTNQTKPSTFLLFCSLLHVERYPVHDWAFPPPSPIVLNLQLAPLHVLDRTCVAGKMLSVRVPRLWFLNNNEMMMNDDEVEPFGKHHSFEDVDLA